MFLKHLIWTSQFEKKLRILMKKIKKKNEASCKQISKQMTVTKHKMKLGKRTKLPANK
jgi:hypothetical protein